MKYLHYLLLIILFMVTACADNDGKTESLPFTKPEILEIASEPKVIIVEVPAVDNSTVIQGKLAQGYVKGATVIADIIQTDSLVGNLQQDPGEVTAVSDAEGNYQIISNYSGYVLFSRGGTVTGGNGEQLPALPMLAPSPVVGKTEIHLTPLTTLVTTQPELKDKLDELGGWDTDIADPDGVPGSLLRVAKTVETVLQILSGGENPLLDTTAAQLAGLGKVAESMNASEDLSSEDSLQEIATESATSILEDPNLVAPSKIQQENANQNILQSIRSSIEVVAANIQDSADPVVEAEIVEEIEQSVTEAIETVANSVSKSVEIGLTFTPVIEEIQFERTASDQLTITAIVSDDGPLTELTFQWSMEGQNFSDPTSNPTVLLNYDDDITGTITLRVTDDNGVGRTTLLSNPLSVGEFPYLLP